MTVTPSYNKRRKQQRVARIEQNKRNIATWIEAARAGDPQAQYMVQEAFNELAPSLGVQVEVTYW
jgi:hypothetical protein